MPSSPAAATQRQQSVSPRRSYVLSAGALLLVAGLSFATFRKVTTPDWEVLPILLLPPIGYLLALFGVPGLFAAGEPDPVRLDRSWEGWLRTMGCLALALLIFVAITGVTNSSRAEIIATLLWGIVCAYAAATAIIILRRNFGPMAHAYSGAVMRESAAGIPTWFRPIYLIGAPARYLARKLFPGISLGLGGVLTLASLLLITSANFGCSDRWYRGYQLFSRQAHWITAENMARGLSQQVSGWAALLAYAAGLVAAVLGVVLMVRGTPRLARITLALSTLALLFTMADGFAALYADSEHSAALPIISLAYVAAAALLLAGRTRNRADIAGLAGLRAAALFVPVLLLSYGMLILIAVFHVWGYVAYFFGVQLLWWGSLQNSRAVAHKT